MSDDSKKQILKATGIIGGAQLLIIITGIIRTKIIAILLGPLGVGVAGMLQSILDLIRNLTGFGLNYSAAKDVAESEISSNQINFNETITILKKLVLITGILGTIVTIIFAKKLSFVTFGNYYYTNKIMFLSITLFFTSLSGGQMAILQGKRQIKKMSQVSIIGALLTTFLSILIYYNFGFNGIVPVLIFTAVIPFLFTWYYTKKLVYTRINITLIETIHRGFSMAKLGFFIVVTGFMSTLTLYIVRSFILSRLNLESVGFFQAAWMITTTYIGVILNSMLADFFPRLSSVNKDNIASNKLINEQIEIALVLGTPMITFFMAFSPLIIKTLYSNSFIKTVPLLQWQLFGSFLTLIMWPIGVMFLSKNKGIFSIITDGIWSISYLATIYFGWNYFGFLILGIGFFVASLIKLISVYMSSSKIGEFSFNFDNKKIIIQFLALTSFMMLNITYINNSLQYIISFIILILITVFSFQKLKNIFPQIRFNFRK